MQTVFRQLCSTWMDQLSKLLTWEGQSRDGESLNCLLLFILLIFSSDVASFFQMCEDKSIHEKKKGSRITIEKRQALLFFKEKSQSMRSKSRKDSQAWQKDLQSSRRRVRMVSLLVLFVTSALLLSSLLLFIVVSVRKIGHPVLKRVYTVLPREGRASCQWIPIVSIIFLSLEVKWQRAVKKPLKGRTKCPLESKVGEENAEHDMKRWIQVMKKFFNSEFFFSGVILRSYRSINNTWFLLNIPVWKESNSVFSTCFFFVPYLSLAICLKFQALNGKEGQGDEKRMTLSLFLSDNSCPSTKTVLSWTEILSLSLRFDERFRLSSSVVTDLSSLSVSLA